MVSPTLCVRFLGTALQRAWVSNVVVSCLTSFMSTEPAWLEKANHNAIAWTVHEICTPLLQRACSQHVSPGEFPSGFSTIPIINSNYAQSPKASATLRAFYRHRSSLWPTNCSNNTTSNSNRSNNYKMELLAACVHMLHMLHAWNVFRSLRKAFDICWSYNLTTHIVYRFLSLIKHCD